MKLHCTKCAFITNSGKAAMAHVRENPTHMVMGPGAAEGTTIMISAEEVPVADEG